METKMKFIQLRAEGLSFDKIAEELEVQKQTLINWSKDFAVEIANLKSIQIESLLEQFYMTKQARIRFFGNKLDMIAKELDNRDLDGIPTEKLFELLIKYAELLKKEEVLVKLKQEQKAFSYTEKEAISKINHLFEVK